MPKYEDDCKKHKVLLGIGIIIFSVVLWLTSSPTSLETNLNWPAAFFVLGILVIIKALIFPSYKK